MLGADANEHGEPSVKSSVSRDSKKRPSSEASKERMRESSIDRKRRWSKVKEEDSDLRVQINELNKRMAAKSKMLLDMEANLKALKGGAPKGEQKLPLTKSAIAMVFSAIKDGLGALSCKCFKCGSPPPQPPCATSSSDPLDNSQPFPCASCSISSQDTPSKFPCEIKCPFHMPPPPCNRWLLERPMCSRPPGPGELVARRVDNDSLLIRWGAPRNTSVTGFDIYVNGTVVNRVRGPGRSIAMLTGLNLGCKTVICVYAMTPSGTYGNPMSTVYQPPTCLPCCKMREKGITDKSSHADVHTYGSKH
ncbi:uncharacterized protein [Anabrus simplex]|uniref:uncharacterized protein n=1 Tax=Anabrus simplex TaxID=316456 RepID=UPI0034DD876B